jgi:hypothetical protein
MTFGRMTIKIDDCKKTHNAFSGMIEAKYHNSSGMMEVSEAKELNISQKDHGLHYPTV